MKLSPIEKIFDDMKLSDDYEASTLDQGLVLGVEVDSINFNLRCICVDNWRLSVSADLYFLSCACEWDRDRIGGDAVEVINARGLKPVKIEIASIDCYCDDELSGLCDLIPKIKDAWYSRMESLRNDKKFYAAC